MSKYKKNENPIIYDTEDIRVYINGDVALLPVVGNLNTMNINLYTIEENKLILIPIITYKGHWIELISGQTKYKENVFCLASDLTEEQRQQFANKIITLEEVPKYLEETKLNLTKK